MHSLSVFLLTCLFMSALPGPNNILAMTHAMHSGYRQACLGVLGRFPAFALLMLVAAILFSFAIAINPLFFKGIQGAGCLYMAYIGIRLILHHQGKLVLQEGKKVRSYFRDEFLTALSNPKAILVFTGFFPNFITPSHSIMGQFLILGLLALGAEACMAMLYVFIGRVMKISNIPFSVIYRLSGIFILSIALRILYGIL